MACRRGPIALSGTRGCPFVHPHGRCASEARGRPSVVDMRRVHDETGTRALSRPSLGKKGQSKEAGSPPSAPGPIESMVESLQRSAGNAAVSRLLGKDAGASDERRGGQSLPPNIQAAGERKLGSDLSAVRVHDDASASTFSEMFGAEAVTLGKDVFMSARPGGPESSSGRRTLMHELVHTVQSSGPSAGSVSGVSSPGSAAEREASVIGADGFTGQVIQPSQVAPAGIAHRKVDEEEPKTEKMPDFLNPEPLSEAELKEGGAPQAPKPGESGEGESVAYEITVMQPLRAAMTAIDQQEWEVALDALQGVGMKLLDYQVAYEKRDPMMYTLLMSARGWLGMVYAQLNRRVGQGSWSDQEMIDHMRDSVGEFERIESKL